MVKMAGDRVCSVGSTSAIELLNLPYFCDKYNVCAQKRPNAKCINGVSILANKTSRNTDYAALYHMSFTIPTSTGVNMIRILTNICM